jgi:hypothetical protein
MNCRPYVRKLEFLILGSNPTFARDREKPWGKKNVSVMPVFAQRFEPGVFCIRSGATSTAMLIY